MTGQLGGRSGRVTRGRDRGAAFAVVAQDGVDGETAERRQLVELVIPGPPTGVRAEPKIEASAARSRGVSESSSSA